MTGDMGTRKASWGMAKRATAFILSFVMAFNTIPTQALADDVAAGKQNEAIEQTEEQVPGTQAVLDEQPSEGVTDAEPAPSDQEVPDQSGDASPPAEEQAGEELAKAFPAFDKSIEVDNVVVRVQVPEGAFPAESKLEVFLAPSELSKDITSAVDAVRATSREVTFARTFGYKVLDKSGNELQPADGKKVDIAFAMDELSTTDVSAEAFAIRSNGTIVAQPIPATINGTTLEVRGITTPLIHVALTKQAQDVQKKDEGQSETKSDAKPVSAVDEGKKETANPTTNAPKTEPNHEQPATPSNQVATNQSKPSQETNSDTVAQTLLRPTQTFSSTTANGVTVNATSDEGAFPKGTTMAVRPVDMATAHAIGKQVAGKKAVVSAVAVDISFTDVHGKEIEPAEGTGVQVTLTLASPLLGRDYLVAHKSDDGTVERVEEVQTANAREAEFVGDEFSIYAVVATGSTESHARRTYEFYKYETDTEPIGSQYVTKTDRLVDPGEPTLNKGERFDGWYYATDTNKVVKTLDELNADLAASNITEGETVKLVAKITATHTITYLDESNDILQVFNVEDGGNFVVVQEYAPFSVNEAFQGWKLGSDGPTYILTVDEANRTITNITADLTLSPVLAQGHWLIYNENDGDGGATYVGPKLITTDVITDTDLPDATTMKRPGYTFDSWNTKEDGTGSVYTAGTNITADTTIYAQWTPAQTTFKVIEWKQSLDDDYRATDKTYDFSYVWSGTATTGMELTDAYVRSLSSGGVRIIPTETPNTASTKYTGFNYARYTISSADGKVSATGDTVINVYFDRQVWEVKLYTNNSYTDLLYDFKGLYGQPFSKYNYVWPANGSYKYKNVSFLGSFTGNLFEANDSLGKTWGLIRTYRENVASSDITIHYWLEDSNNPGTYLSDETARYTVAVEKPFNVTSRYAASECGGYVWSTSANKPSDSAWKTNYTINSNGTFTGDTRPSDSYKHLHLKYDLHRGRLRFFDSTINAGNLLKTYSNVPYGTSLASYESQAPTVNPPANYTFDGWYKDSAGVTSFDWNTTMVDGGADSTGGVSVYAKYLENRYRVVLDTCDSTDAPATFVSGASRFTKGLDEVIEIGTLQREGYSLVGWYLDPDYTTPFELSTPMNDATPGMDLTYRGSDEWYQNNERKNVAGKLTLYAKWRPNAKVRIVYDVNGGSDAPSDNKLYSDEAMAAPGSPCTPPAGKLFKCWTYEHNSTHQMVDVESGHLFEVRLAAAKDTETANVREIKLVASYVDPFAMDPVTITYKTNGGTGTDYTQSIGRNESFGAPDGDTVGFSKANSLLVGWSHTPGATSIEYAVGDTVAADGDTTLYAVWDTAVTLTFASNDAAYGTVSESSIVVAKNTTNSVTVEATPATNYHLFNWTTGSSEVETNTTLTLTKPAGGWVDANYVANFEHDHTHEWGYEATNNTVVATCANTDTGHKGDTQVTLTLNVTDVTYGTPVEVVIDNQDGIGETGATVSAVRYVGTDSTSYAESTAAPTQAGTYKAMVTVTKGDSSYTAEKTFTISPKGPSDTEPLTFTLSSDTQTYDGNAHKPEVSNVKLGTTNLVAGRDYEVEYTNNTNAGTATAKVVLKGNYAGQKTEDFTISKADITPAISLANKSYDGQPVSPSVTGNPGNGAVSYAYQKKDGDNWVDIDAAPSEAGTYRVTATVAETDNYNGGTTQAKEFTISKASPEVTPPTALNPTFTGKPQSLVSAGQTSGGTIKYSLDGQNWSDQIPQATNEGTYTVHYKVEGNDNYNGEPDQTLTVTIGAKTLTAEDYTIALSNTVFTYNKTEQKPTVTITLNDTDHTELIENTDFTVAYTVDSTNAGNKVATIAFIGNYAGADATKDYTIEPKTLTASDVTFTGSPFTFTGAPQGPTIVVTDGGDNDTLTLGADYTVENGTQTNYSADPYTVTVRGAGNYTGVVTDAYQIVQATLDSNNLANEKKPKPKTNLEYDASAQTLIDSPASVPTGYTMQYRLDGTHWSATLPTATNAGTYDVYVMYKGDSNHSDVVLAQPIPVTIAKKPVTITPQTGQSKVFGEDDPVFTYEVDGLAGSDKLSGALGRESGEDVKAGGYAFKVDDLNDKSPNYNASLVESASTFAILPASQDTPAKPAVTATYNSVTVTNGKAGVTYTLTDKDGHAVAGVDPVTPTEDGAVTFQSLNPATEYVVTAQTAADTNHNASPEESTNITTPREGQEAPTGITAAGASAKDATDGKVSGVNDTMEYSTDGGANWTAVPANTTEVSGLPAGEFLVRYKKTSTKDSSPATSVMITFDMGGTVTWNYRYTYIDTDGVEKTAVVDDNSNQRSKFARVELYNGATKIADKDILLDVSSSVSGTVETASKTYKFEGLSTQDANGNPISYRVEVVPLMVASDTDKASNYVAFFTDDAHLNATINYTQDCFDATWTVKIKNADTASGAVPDTVYVKVLYGTTATGGTDGTYGGYKVITQQAIGNGTACGLGASSDNDYAYEATGSFPVWKSQPGNGGTYYHKVIVWGYQINGKFYDVSSSNIISQTEPMTYNTTMQKASHNMVVTIDKLDVPMVEFNPNGGFISNGYLLVDKGGTVTTAQINAKVPTWENHIFEGWYTTADKTGQKQESNITNITQKVTLYAHWSIVVADANKPTAKNLTYNGQAQELVNAPESLPEGCSKAKYSIDGGATWTEDLPKAIDAGQYTVKVRYVGNDSHNDVDGEDVVVTIAPKRLTQVMLSGTGTSLIYSGAAQGPSVMVHDGTTTLVEGENKDYKLSNTTATTAGSYAVTVTGTGNYTGSVQLPFTISPYVLSPNDKIIVSGIEDSFVYDGQEHRPNPNNMSVTLQKANGESTALVYGSDYTVAYPNESVSVGNYEITVTLLYNYEGVSTKGYKIVPRSITDDDVVATPTQFIYSSKAQGPEIVVTSNLQDENAQGTDVRMTLAYNTDYLLTGEKAIGVGTYTATITGTGNYMGRVQKTYTIVPYQITDADKLEISFDDGEQTFTYTGSDQRPKNVTVTLNGITIGAGQYTVAYYNKDGQVLGDGVGSVDAGAYYATITFKEGSNYTGSASKGYIINPKPLTATDVQTTFTSESPYTYTGGNLGPTVAVVDTGYTTDGTTATGRTLTQGTDYIVADALQKNVGTYTMLVKGTGNYSGEISQQYEIKKTTTNPINLAENNLPTVKKTDGYDGLVYNGTPQTLVNDPQQNPEGYPIVIYSTDGGATWVREPQGIDAGDYPIVVKFVGDANHEDFNVLVGEQTATLTAKIVPRKVKITGNSGSKAYNGTEQEITGFTAGPVSENANDSTPEGLVSGHDVSGLTHTAKGTVKGSYTGTFDPASGNAVTILKSSDNTNVSSNYDVTLASGTLTISQNTVNDDGTIDKVGEGKVGDQIVVTVTGTQNANAQDTDAPIYDALPHEPVVVDNQVVGSDGKPKVLVKGTDYTVAYYSPSDIDSTTGNPTASATQLTADQAGEKVAIVTLTGNYGGTVKVRMDVRRRPVTFTGETATKPYNGKEQSITGITVGGSGLVTGHTHNISYEARGTNKGEYQGAFAYAGESATAVVITATGGTDVTSNYAISSTAGKLTISAKAVDANNDGIVDNLTDDDGRTVTDTDGRPVPIVSLSGSDGDAAPLYNDQDHAPSVVDNAYVNPDTNERKPKTLVPGTDYTVAYYEANTDGTPNASKPIEGDDAAKVAGNKVAVITFTEASGYTGTVNVSVDVRQRTLVLTGASDTTNYTGAIQEVSDITLRGDGLVSGHQHNASYLAQGVTKGTYNGQFSYDAGADSLIITNASGANVTSNYKVTLTPGKLTIKATKVIDDGNGGGVLAGELGTPVDANGQPTTNPAQYVKVVDAQGNDGDQVPIYDGTPQAPKIYDTKATDDNGQPITKQLVEGTDYDVVYYDASDILDDGTPKTGATPTNATDTGDKVAVVTLKGDYEGTVNVPVDVAKRPVSFTGNSDTQPYNGQMQYVTGYTASTDEDAGLLTGVDFGHTTTLPSGVDSVQSRAEGKKASTTPYAGTITAADDVVIMDKDNNNVTKNYDITTQAGTLTITVVKVGDDGTGTGKGVLVNESGAPVDENGWPATNPNQYVRVVDAQGKDDDEAPIYDGTPKVPEIYDVNDKDDQGRPKKLVEGTDYDVVYYDASDILDNGTPKTGATPTNATDAGDKVAVVTLKGDYEGTVNVPVDVAKRPVSFTGNNASYSYDGETHTVTTYDVGGSGLANGHTKNISYLASGKDKGDYSGEFTDAEAGPNSNILDADGNPVAQNYVITLNVGTLTIGATRVADDGKGNAIEVDENGNPKTDEQGNPVIRITVTVDYDNSNPPTYDGKDHKPTVHDVLANEDLAEGTDYNLAYYEPKTDEDGKPTSEPDLNKPIVNGSTAAGDKVAVVTLSKDYSGAVAVRADVRKRPVSFVGNSVNKSYSGKEQVLEGYQVSKGEGIGLLTDEQFGHTTIVADPDSGATSDSVIHVATGTKAGSYAGTMTEADSVRIVDKNNNDVTANYSITTKPGTLNIAAMTVNDGDPTHAVEPLKDDDGNPLGPNGERLTPTENGGYVNESGDPVEPVPAVTVVGTNPSDKEAGHKTPGTEASAEDTPIYDGSEHGPKVVDNGSGEELKPGEDYTVEYYKPEDIGEDGKPKEGAKPLVKDPTKDDSAFDAGDKVAVIEFMGDHTGTVVSPTTIAKRPLHVTTQDATKEYDGTPLVNADVTVQVAGSPGVPEGQGLVGGQTIEVIVTGSQTEPGSSANTVVVRFKDEAKDKSAEGGVMAESADEAARAQSDAEPGLLDAIAGFFSPRAAYADASNGLATDGSPTAKRSNYDLVADAADEGTLTVTAANVGDDTGKPGEGKRVVVTPLPSGDPSKGPATDANDKATYTGKPIAGPELYDTSVTDENGNPKKLEEGTDYTVTYYEANPDGTPNLNKPIMGKPSDAGSYAMVVTYTGDYEGTYTTPVTIAKAKLTVKTPSASKTYDGKALTTGEKDASITGFVNGESAPFEVTGTQTEVGSSKNTYKIAWDDPSATAKEQNYEVAETLGTLKVTASRSTSTSSTKSSGTSSKSTAKTGDTTIMVWPLVAGAAGALLAGVRRRRRK